MKGHFEKGAWVEEKPIPDEDFDDKKIELNNAFNSLDFVKVQKVPFENYGYFCGHA